MKYYNCPKILQNKEDLDFLLTGFFFRSENDISTNYLVSPKEINKDKNAVIEIYSTGCIQNGDPEINNGDEVATENCLHTNLLCTVDLWGKYFFPKYENLQLYYDDKKYYGEKYNNDSVISLAEALNFAIEKGLKLAEIKPY